jgi:putative chitinase
MYDPFGGRPNVAKQLGNDHRGDGEKYFGRGYVQLTGKRNYAHWSTKLKVDLVGNPNLALDAAIAVKILFEGMISGSFTGKNFANYLSGAKSDWAGARRIINGTDKAQLIASYATRYYAALSYTT